VYSSAFRNILAGAILVGVALASGGHAKQPGQYVLAPESETALVVVKTDFWEPAPSMHSAFKIIISAYDPEAGKLLGGPYSGGGLFEAQEKKFFGGYLIAAIKPGRWVFQSYTQQDKWALCFNANTRQFDVKPGEVVFLGDLDAKAHRDQLTQRAVRTGRVSISGYGFADFFDLPDGPRLAPIDDAQLADLRAALARHIPKVTAPVRAANYSPAQFGTGSTLFAERKCGGYFSTSATKKKGK
jgi:hypothetical protein